MEGLTFRNSSAETVSRPKNPELEIDFRAACSASQLKPSLYDPPPMQACQDYLNSCQQGASVYNLKEDGIKTNLIIYNTETDTQEVKLLKAPEILDLFSCLTQLPNGKLFCFGSYKFSGIAAIIDTNGGVEMLPSGALCMCSSCIYFNNSVYCFGGKSNSHYLTLSCRFDLYQNRWIQLTPMPQADCMCNSIMFKGDILISGCWNRNLLLYSIDINSFSIIPYEFVERTRKILINPERPYLIECNNTVIYESEIGSYTNWRKIGGPSLLCIFLQVYCSYNKGFIYIGISASDYFKFDLNEKRLYCIKKP